MEVTEKRKLDSSCLLARLEEHQVHCAPCLHVKRVIQARVPRLEEQLMARFVVLAWWWTCPCASSATFPHRHPAPSGSIHADT